MNFREISDLVGREHANDYVVATLYGLGDTYFIAGYGAEFVRRHRRPIVYVVKSSHVDLVRMFDTHSRVIEVPDAEAGAFLGDAHADYDPNMVPGRVFVAHPHFARVGAHFAAPAGRVTHAWMYALILELRQDAPLTLPRVSDEARREAVTIADNLGIVPGKTAVLFPHANSYPPPDPGFWSDLEAALTDEGWMVWRNNPDVLPLRCVLPFMEQAGWAIGANCGMMQTIISSRVKCRKTLLTRDPNGLTWCPAPYFRDVDGQIYDIEEFHVPTSGWNGIVNAVARGRCARGPMPSAEPQFVCDVTLPPGEVIDRLTVLHLKTQRLPAKAHMLTREIAQLSKYQEMIMQVPGVAELAEQLYHLNAVAWDKNQILFDLFENSDLGKPDWSLDKLRHVEAEMCVKAFRAAGIDANHERIRLKNRINVLCGSSDREEKSYDT